MKSTVDRFASDPHDAEQGAVLGADQPSDVPGMLAGRIGDLWASEERSRRKERTGRLMMQAASSDEEPEQRS
ncbi:MAG: hypothetical protein HGB10_07640 [Coriobacteriia bacterium]|nr:hypothetical protein [Coriobacteriia bacterium]